MARSVKPKTLGEVFKDRETTFNERVKRMRGYHIVLGDKLLGTNPSYAGALKTANNIGPDVKIVKR